MKRLERRGAVGIRTFGRAAGALIVLLVLGLFGCSGQKGPETGGVERPPPEGVELVFLDVGQGDAILVRSPEGKTALIDGGRGSDLAKTLRARGIASLDLVVASHAHADHIGGLRSVLSALPVRFYMDNAVPHTTSTYRELMQTVLASGVAYLRPTERTIRLGSVSLRILPPPPVTEGEPFSAQNDQSIGIVVEFGEFRALLTGDSEVGEIRRWLAAGVPGVTLLKAAHHGSRNGVTPAWLAATRPELVVISVGRDNPYGHPHPAALRYYEAVAKAVYRTDRDGTVTVTAFAGGGWTVEHSKNGGRR